ncbi:MAG: tetratricopeptide repeat protein [Candidatus Hodarchaeales archaeon]
MKYPKIHELIKQGQFDKAIQMVEELSSEDYIEGLILKGKSLMWKGEFGESLKVIQKALSEAETPLQELKASIIQGYVLAHLRKPIQLASQISEVEELISRMETDSEEIQECQGTLAFLKGWQYFFRGEGEKSVDSIRKSLEIHKNLDNPLETIFSLVALTAFHHVFSIGDFKLRNEYAQKSLALSKEIKNSMFQALAHIAIGYANWAFNTDITLSHFEKAMKLNQELENKYLSGLLLSDIGILHMGRENYDLSLEYFGKSAEILKNLGSPSYSLSMALIGDIHQARGNLEKALDLYQKSLEGFESSGNIIRVIDISIGIGKIHYWMGDLELALETFNRSLSKAKEANYKSSIAWSQEWLSCVYIHQGELNKALATKEQSLKLFNVLEDHHGISFCYRRFGDIFRLQGDYSQAIKYYEDGIQLLTKTFKGDDKELFGIVSSVLVQLSLIAEDLDDADKANVYLRKLRELQQSSKFIYVELRTRFVEALVLKMSKRGTMKLQAIEQFQNIVNEPVVDFEITIYAMIFLCELLILELKISDSAEELFLEIIDLTNRFFDNAHTQKSPFFIVMALILKSKIALVRGEIEEVDSFLNTAEEIADKKKLLSLSKNIKTEQEVIQSELDKWNELTLQNAPLRDRIEHAQVLNYLQEAKKLQEAWTHPKLTSS